MHHSILHRTTLRSSLAASSLTLLLAATMCTTGCGVINGIAGDARGDDPSQDMGGGMTGKDMDTTSQDMGTNPCETCDGLCVAIYNDKSTRIKPDAATRNLCVPASRLTQSSDDISYNRNRTVMAYDPDEDYLYAATSTQGLNNKEKTIDIARVNVSTGMTIKKRNVSLGDRTTAASDLLIQAIHPTGQNNPEVLVVSQLIADTNASRTVVHQLSSELSNTAPIDHSAQDISAIGATYNLNELRTPPASANEQAPSFFLSKEETLFVAGGYCEANSPCAMMRFSFPFPQGQGEPSRVFVSSEQTDYIKTQAIHVQENESNQLYSTLSINPDAPNQSSVEGFLVDAPSRDLSASTFNLNTPTTKFDSCPSASHYFDGYATSPQHRILNTQLNGDRILFEAISMLTPPNQNTVKYLAWQEFAANNYLSCLELDTMLTNTRLLHAQYEDQGSSSNDIYAITLQASLSSPSSLDTLIIVHTDNMKNSDGINYYTVGITDADNGTKHQIIQAFIEDDELIIVTSSTEEEQRPLHIFKLSLDGDFPISP